MKFFPLFLLFSCLCSFSQVSLTKVKEFEDIEFAESFAFKGNLWACADDETIFIWDGYNVIDKVQRDKERDFAGNAFFSKDSKYFYSGLTVFDLKTKKEIYNSKGILFDPSAKQAEIMKDNNHPKNEKLWEKADKYEDDDNCIKPDWISRSYDNSKIAVAGDVMVAIYDGRKHWQKVEEAPMVIGGKGKKKLKRLRFKILSDDLDIEKVLFGKSYLAGIGEGHICFWNNKNLSKSKTDTLLFNGNKKIDYYDLAFLKDHELITVSDDGQLMAWDLKAKKLLAASDNKAAGDEPIIACHPNGNIFATGDADGKICIWQNDNGKLKSILTHTLEDEEVAGLSFDEKGDHLYVQGDSLYVFLFKN
ncbi:MAG: Anaphase-promoting complex subunit 4 domain [Bacteroidetes bacterium]|jgi:WD40 repeat protein|nr:Anaphase-promoting complex subunit 4 domain [Bacteroidota bacterium]